MFRKVLVANRGEIAIRAFRAAYELGAATVAVFPQEDRNSEHRLKADEAYQIGEVGHPVRAYLSIEAVIDAARRSGADAIYPGYGFMSENPGLATACEQAGITFIGPPPRVLAMAGNKHKAVSAAREAGVPVLDSTDPSDDMDTLLAAAEEMTYPIFVKAVAGGGGRGMRLVKEPAALRESLQAAMNEASSAFGDATVILEQAVIDPRHIEVQILADGAGHVMHLFERDCSVQRRHQKVVEIAPAPHLSAETREAICADAVKFAEQIGYVNAGTVEFLLDGDGNHHFIEMNPRIQVEHTVTEEVADVDLVACQMRIASGETLDDLGLSQDSVALHGFALQCRITTEDPSNEFRPDIGMISAYRSASGSGVRLDGGTAYAGAQISAHFDSLLVKVTCRGRDFTTAVRRARRALAEFRVRGVSTNIPFLMALLDEPDFREGRVTTSFIAEHPHLLSARAPADRGTRLMSYLADVTVNKPNGDKPHLADPREKLPVVDLDVAPPDGSKQRLGELGPEGFAGWLREQTTVGVTDTTFRDAHQSLLATRVRTRDLLEVAPHVARTTPELLSLECWGGATYDVALRFLAEDPWERLGRLREAVPNICLQMLLRGRNTVGYTPYPTEVTDAFVAEAARTGIDIFRIFDALNDISQMRPAIDAVRQSGGAVAEVALCYTGDLMNPGEKLYTLDYYLGLAEQIVEAGAHVLAIKDMAGLLRPAGRAQARHRAARALRPARAPAHPRHRGRPARDAHRGDRRRGRRRRRRRRVDGRHDLAAVALGPGRRDRPLRARDRPVPRRRQRARALLGGRPQGLRAVRGRAHLADRPRLPPRDPRRAALQPAPAGRRARAGGPVRADRGRLRRRRPDARAPGQGDAVVQGRRRPRAALRRRRGRPRGLRGRSHEVRHPRLGHRLPARGARRPARRMARAAAVPRPWRAGPSGPGLAELTDDDRKGLESDRAATLNELLFPGPTKEFREHRTAYGDTSVLRSQEFFYGLEPELEYAVDIDTGVQLLIELEAISEPDERALRTVLMSLNGQLRPVQVRDRSVDTDVKAVEKADKNEPGHVAAPFAGVVTLQVSEGDEVAAGATVATIEAMKMEASITAQKGGTVERVAIGSVQQVEGGDLVVVLA